MPEPVKLKQVGVVARASDWGKRVPDLRRGSRRGAWAGGGRRGGRRAAYFQRVQTFADGLENADWWHVPSRPTPLAPVTTVHAASLYIVKLPLSSYSLSHDVLIYLPSLWSQLHPPLFSMIGLMRLPLCSQWSPLRYVTQ